MPRGISAAALVLLLVGWLLSAGPAPVPAAVGHNPSFPIPFASGSLAPVGLPRSHPAPATLKFGFNSPDRDGVVPELAAISVLVSRQVIFDTTGIPSCSLGAVLESYEKPGPLCPRSLVGGGRVVAEITPREGAPVVVTGHLRAFYSDDGYHQILAQITTGEPLPLVYVIPFTIEPADPPYRTRLVVRRPEMHRLPGSYAEGVRLIGAYSRISSLEMSLHHVVGRGARRRSFVSAECPLPPKVALGELDLLRIDLEYEQYFARSGVVERTCKAR